MVVNKKFDKNDSSMDALKYISQGGNVRADMEITTEEWKTISLRIPVPLLQSVDGKVKQRAALTRTAWILEAIQQKLKAEEQHERQD